MLKKLPLHKIILFAIFTLICSVLSSFNFSLVWLLSFSSVFIAIIVSDYGFLYSSIITLASFILSFALNGNVFFALRSILYIIPALIIYLFVKRKIDFTFCFISISVVFVSIAIVSFEFDIYSYYGSFYDGTRNYISELRDSIISFANDYSNKFNSLFTSIYGESYSNIITADYILSYVREFKFILPGLIVLLAEYFSYATSKMFQLINHKNKTGYISNDDCKVIILFPTIAIFIFTFIINLFGLSSIFGYVCVNLMYIFMPILSIFGIKSMFGPDSAFRKSRKISVKIITIVLLVLLFNMGINYFISYLALWGATTGLFIMIKSRISNNNSSNDDDSNNNE